MMNNTTETNSTPYTIENMEKVSTSPPVAPATSLPTLPSPDLTFPWRLYILLKNVVEGTEQNSDIISWTHTGASFQITNKKLLASEYLPKYFKMSKYKSFTRQLSAYGFTCTKHRTLPSVMVWSHPNFVNGNPDGCYLITRRRKGAAKSKASSSPASNIASANAPSSKDIGFAVSDPTSFTPTTVVSSQTGMSPYTTTSSNYLSYSEPASSGNTPSSTAAVVSHSNKYDMNKCLSCLQSTVGNGQEQLQQLQQWSQNLQKHDSPHQHWQQTQDQEHEMPMVRFSTPTPPPATPITTPQVQQRTAMSTPMPMEDHVYRRVSQTHHCISPSEVSDDSCNGSHDNGRVDSFRMAPTAPTLTRRIPEVVSCAMTADQVKGQCQKATEKDCFEPLSLKTVVGHEQRRESTFMSPTYNCCSIQDLDKALGSLKSVDRESSYSSSTGYGSGHARRVSSDDTVLLEPRKIEDMHGNDTMDCWTDDLKTWVEDCDLHNLSAF